MGKKLTKLQQQQQHSSISWKDALQNFLFFKQAQGISKTTMGDYKRHANYFFSRYPDSWNSSTFKTCIMEYMSDSIKPATFNLRLIYLRTFFDYCINEGYLQENPLKDFKKRKAQGRVVDISEDTLQRLLTLPDQNSFAGLRDYALLMFELDTGVRPKEALSLKIEDFDFNRYTATVPAEEAKTRTARTLPILPVTAQAVKRLVNYRHPNWKDDIPVFCSCEGTHLERSSWRRRLDMYSEKLGIKIRPYDLRHSFALIYLRNGGHAFGLQKTLGHTDMTMTKRYVNLSGDDLADSHRTASPLTKLVTVKKRDKVRSLKI